MVIKKKQKLKSKNKKWSGGKLKVSQYETILQIEGIESAPDSGSTKSA